MCNAKAHLIQLLRIQLRWLQTQAQIKHIFGVTSPLFLQLVVHGLEVYLFVMHQDFGIVVGVVLGPFPLE
jgi:hypothetical protein